MTAAMVGAGLLVVVVIAVLRTVLAQRAEQERAGLFGERQARLRRGIDQAREQFDPGQALANVRAASTQLTRLAFSGARVTSIGPLLQDWWQLVFADGTTLFVLPADDRACRLELRRAPVVIEAWSPRSDGLSLVLAAPGDGSRRLQLRDVLVVAPGS